jgi:3-hydroxybutyryl-CoA dehydrogenase
MDIKKVGVVGCGLMGHGIAQVSAQSGYDVVVREVSQEKLDSGLGKIQKQLGRAVEKGRMEQSAADELFGRITPSATWWSRRSPRISTRRSRCGRRWTRS